MLDKISKSQITKFQSSSKIFIKIQSLEGYFLQNISKIIYIQNIQNSIYLLLLDRQKSQLSLVKKKHIQTCKLFKNYLSILRTHTRSPLERDLTDLVASIYFLPL